MSVWLVFLFVISAGSAAALLAYIRQARKAGDCLLVAHGLILLIGLVLAGLGVAALKILNS